jgi:hypothetical protein
MGGSDNGDAHSSIEISTDFGVGFLSLLSKQGRECLQQNVGFFAEESIR